MNQNFKIVITTQALENYGFEEGRDYWKAKCGSDYVVLTNEEFTGEALLDLVLVDAVNAFIEEALPSNEMYREYPIDTQIVGMRKASSFEEDQMTFDGCVDYYDLLFVMTRDFETGIRTFREASESEIAEYRAQLRFPITEEA